MANIDDALANFPIAVENRITDCLLVAARRAEILVLNSDLGASSQR